MDHSMMCKSIDIVSFTATFVLSRNGKKMIWLDGYTYYVSREFGYKTTWRCSTHNRKGCHATIYTIEGEIVKAKTYHNH